ncbi:unnamed protein product [Effrenium voratum]|nr:unnamed protein product [Effrenium voratum]
MGKFLEAFTQEGITSFGTAEALGAATEILRKKKNFLKNVELLRATEEYELQAFKKELKKIERLQNEVDKARTSSTKHKKLCELVGQPPPEYWTMSTTPESHTEGVRHSAQARRAVVEPHEGPTQRMWCGGVAEHSKQDQLAVLIPPAECGPVAWIALKSAKNMIFTRHAERTTCRLWSVCWPRVVWKSP